ncbi:hypothetical protein JCM11641_005221 [Rhodosporidiobolus odoratus]
MDYTLAPSNAPFQPVRRTPPPTPPLPVPLASFRLLLGALMDAFLSPRLEASKRRKALEKVTETYTLYFCDKYWWYAMSEKDQENLFMFFFYILDEAAQGKHSELPSLTELNKHFHFAPAGTPLDSIASCYAWHPVYHKASVFKASIMQIANRFDPNYLPQDTLDKVCKQNGEPNVQLFRVCLYRTLADLSSVGSAQGYTPGKLTNLNQLIKAAKGRMAHLEETEHRHENEQTHSGAANAVTGKGSYEPDVGEAPEADSVQPLTPAAKTTNRLFDLADQNHLFHNIPSFFRPHVPPPLSGTVPPQHNVALLPVRAEIMGTLSQFRDMLITWGSSPPGLATQATSPLTHDRVQAAQTQEGFEDALGRDVAKGWEDGRQEGDGEGTLRLKSSTPSASTCSPQKDPEWLTFASSAPVFHLLNVPLPLSPFSRFLQYPPW